MAARTRFWAQAGLIATSAVTALGACSLVYHATQPVSLKVLDERSGEPVQDASVTFAEFSGEPFYDYRARTTDSGGNALLDMDVFMPGPDADAVTGREFTFQVTKGAQSDVFDVVIIPGVESHGSRFKVLVHSVGEERQLTLQEQDAISRARYGE
jgi:hypothetical protein